MKSPEAETYSPVDHDVRWRPNGGGPFCGADFRGTICSKRGPHYCEPRADRVVAFFAELLVHIAGPLQRTPFLLRHWQEHEIVRPLFGEVTWSEEWDRYVRRYRMAYIIVARKNGKSELAAGILLYMLVGDGEERAECYGAAADTKQAGKVFEPAQRMMELSPVLSKRLRHNKHARRIYDVKTFSHYEIITADAKGELGHNPHCFNLDEVLSQRDGSLYDAMTTAVGARCQEMILCTTTETNDPDSFGADLIDEAERVLEDAARAPHVFAFVRKLPQNAEQLDRLHEMFPGHPDLPVSTDPFDEANWRWPNPALDQFLSRESLRRAKIEALNDPARENAFRQFKVNQRVQQLVRWMPMHLFDASTGETWTPTEGWEHLAGRDCWAGFDLSAKLDLTSWCLVFPPLVEGDPVDLLWRFWLPESAVTELDKHTEKRISRWVEEGWITVAGAKVLDYATVTADMAKDANAFRILGADCDEWSSWPVIQLVGAATYLDPERDIQAYKSTFDRMSPGLETIMSLVKDERFAHHGNPVARWCFENAEVRRMPQDQERIRIEKPARSGSGKRVDGAVASTYSINAFSLRMPEEEQESAYESGDLLIV